MAKDILLNEDEIPKILCSLEDRNYLKVSCSYDENGNLSKVCELFI